MVWKDHQAALGISPADLTRDLNTMGLMFETMAVRDLRVYADALDGRVYHYRDKSGLECDAVVHLRNGDYGLVEIKLGGDTLIEEGAKTLKNLAKKIDTDRMKEPSFLMVLTGVGEFPLRRSDGVYVVPICPWRTVPTERLRWGVRRRINVVHEGINAPSNWQPLHQAYSQNA